jgi:hypothetical protein
VARWARQLGAVTDVEYAQVEEAVYAKWKQRRIRGSQGAARYQASEHIQASGDRAAEEACTLIPQIPQSPETVIPQLRATSQGCSFLLQQFQLLRERLATHGFFEVSQRRWCLNLFARRSDHLFIDPHVYDLDRLYLGAIGGVGSFTALQAANAFLLDRPDDMSDGEFARRLEPMVENLPAIAEGQAGLIKLVDAAIAELTERVGLLRLRERDDREVAEINADTDVTPDGALRVRYDGMAGREHHAALRQFRALRDDRLKHGTDDCAAETDEAQNEATVPEVNGAAEEAKGPIDVTGPRAGDIPNPNSQIPNESQIPSSRSQTNGAQHAPNPNSEVT